MTLSKSSKNFASFFGFAFECIIDTFDENALIRGITRGKYSFELLFTGLNGEIDKAACTGGMNSLRSAIPFHDLTDTELECCLPFGLYLHQTMKIIHGSNDEQEESGSKKMHHYRYVSSIYSPR